MGNTKVYTFRFPLSFGECLVSRQEIEEVARSSIVALDTILDGDTPVAMGMVESSSQVADELISFLRRRYPKRWCVITRFDADWSDFKTISWDEGDETPKVFVADAWRQIRVPTDATGPFPDLWKQR